MRPIRARIDSAALRHNLGAARLRAPRSRICAVVKANAYGHGLARAARAFAAAEGLALIELEAALELRRTGERRPILLLQGFFSPEELEPIAAHGLTTVVHNPEQLAMLEEARLPGRIAVVAKLNTGMNRLGFPVEDLSGVLDRLRNCPGVGAVALMTHFADADGKRGVRWQLERFEAATTGVDLPRSLANSAALLRYPESHKDWVRPGIMLYGCSPFPDESAEALGLKPAMTLASELIAVRDLRPGDSVGYGGTYTASGPMRIGIVACGYADGYPRHAPTGTPILVCGRRTRTLGRVAMDVLFADLTGIPEAAVGSPATLWGEGLSADEVAASAGTVSYELLCALTPRVPVSETP
ncbi:MAG: alanine racemase [Betaproteobacteria bacterium]|nr:MAG: alanine racemase [Betaproteobacteria bacterium]TMH71162.1 MAG: alanine racemase [Betaproteobacteria bacterium]